MSGRSIGARRLASEATADFGVGARLGRDDPAHAARVGEGAQTIGEGGEVGIAGERQRRGARGRGKRRGGAQGGEESSDRATAPMAPRRFRSDRRAHHWSP